MFYIIIELNGYKQLLRLDAGLAADLESILVPAAEVRGGRRIPSDGGHLVYGFPTRDAGEAVRVLDAVFDLRNGLRQLSDRLMGFLILAEYYPDATPQEAVRRDLTGVIRAREMDDSLLFGPEAVDLFRPFCEVQKDGACFRARERTKTPGPNLGDAGTFSVRPPIVERLLLELAPRLDCGKPPEVFLVYGPIFSGVGCQVDVALKTLMGFSPVCRVYPGPSGSDLPVFDCPGFDDIPDYLSATERKVWREKKEIFTPGLLPDFPAEEGFAAFSLATGSFIRRCEDGLYPAVLVCEDIHAMSVTARGILARVFRENLPGWRLFPVCTSRNADLGSEFRGLPCERFHLPPLGADEVREKIRGLPGGTVSPKKAIAAFRRSKGRITALYYELLAEGPPEDGPFEDIGSAVRVLRGQERILREVLRIIMETGDLLSPRLMEDFLEGRGVTRAQFRDIIRRLAEMGFLRDEGGLVPRVPEIRSFLRQDETLRKAETDEPLSAYLYDRWKKDGAAGREGVLLEYFLEAGRIDYAVEAFNALAASILDMDGTERARELIRDRIPDIPGAELRPVLLAARLRLALCLDDPDGMVEAFARLEDYSELLPTNPYYGECLLQKAAYSLKLRDVRGALSPAKSAVMFFQERSDGPGLTRANNAIGLAMLASDNPEEALDYFRIARESSPGGLRSLLLVGMTQFVLGNFSRTLETCAAAAEEADSLLERRLALASRFVAGRARFELGDYSEARNVFESLLSGARSLGYSAPMPVLYAWLGRCLAYLGDPAGAKWALAAAGPGPEAVFFQAEAEYFRGDSARARDLLDIFLRIPYEGDCFLGDAIFWKDGFYFTENLCTGRTRGMEALPHLARAFHAYLSGSVQGAPAGVEDMARLMRDEKASANDPYTMLYYFWYSGILPEKQDPAYEDRMTILGRAVRNLQTRKSRIDDPEHKAAFTGKNYWNRLIMEDARRHNLV